MDWQKGINNALNYIENNLLETIDLTTLSKYIGCSTWEFQRIFSFLAHVSIGEYIRQRKLTLAAHDIQTSDLKIIDIALKYGYESPTAFSRAFSKLFGVAPSFVRDNNVNLTTYPKITFEFIDKERFLKMNKFSERGYIVRENGPVYFTKNMEGTIHWFENVLGWYGGIVARDSSGNPDYGCVYDYPDEIAIAHLTPFRGFHLFSGNPIKGVAGFLMIEGLEEFHRFVKNNGWNEISDIISRPWGAKECTITTIDGCILRFFESIH